MRIGILSSMSTAILLLVGCFGVRTQTNAHDMKTVAGRKNIVPLVIIGSGPAGLSAAIYGARAQIYHW